MVYLQAEVEAELICGGLVCSSAGQRVSLEEHSRRTEVTVLAFVGSHAVWDRLLGLSVFKCTEVEGFLEIPDLVNR